MAKVACFSVAAIDYFPQLNSFFAGGNALNQAIRLSSLGMKATFLGAVGKDIHGGKIIDLLLRRNVDISQAEILDGVTASNRIINDASGERFGEEGAWRGGVFENHKLSDKNWNYIRDFQIWATHSSCPDFSEALKRKRKNFLCVDYLHLPDLEVLVHSVDRVDIAYIGGDESMIDTLQDLSTKVDSLIVLTMGSSGCIALQNGRQTRQKALTVGNVVDTTGCGDAFQSAFTQCFFMNRDIKLALERGAKMGDLAAMHHGGVEW